MPYVKLDTKMLNSSLWVSDYRTRITFLTMLLMADSEGVVHAKAPGIAHAAVLPLEDVRNAIDVLSSPDPDSRSENDDGRRIRPVEGGFHVINYLKYREKDHTHAERQRRYRERKRQERDASPESRVTSLSSRVTEGDTSRSRSICKEKTCARFDEFWSVWPKKKAKPDAQKAWAQIGGDEIADDLIAHVEKRKRQDPEWLKDDGEFIPYPATFLRGKRWEDEWEAADKRPDPMDGVL